MNGVFEEIEIPTSYYLYQMEREGVHVDKEELSNISKLLESRVLALETEYKTNRQHMGSASFQSRNLYPLLLKTPAILLPALFHRFFSFQSNANPCDHAGRI